MQLWGHSADSQGRRHALEDHLRGTGHRAAGFAEVFDAAELAGYLGLVHDVGKGTCAWQDGLLRVEGTNNRVGIPHKHAGTWLAEQGGLGVLAGVVFGHHGGLPSLSDLKAELRWAEGAGEASVREAVERVAAVVPEIHASPGLPPWLEQAVAEDPFVVDVLMRMVFSAVVDADYLDTEAHFQGGPRSTHPLRADQLVDRFEKARQAMLADVAPSPVDGLRQEVYAQAVEGALGPMGFYRLPAPTGSGKTLAASGFALHHARAHGLRRVVVAVPYMSITEQNAAIYRGLLDHAGEPPAVLEHHSGVDLDEGTRAGRWQRLAAENWDAPFVVTTTVRLFESLFHCKPAAMRRLHRLAGSVIVLDEVQALPDRLLVPILSMLRTLCERFRVTVLLASATQPEFWQLSPVRELPVHDLVAEPRPLYEQLRRVRYEWWTDPRPTLAEVAERVAAEPAALAVCNTTAQAAELHLLVEKQRESSQQGPVLHLSTRMAAQHRKDTLDHIRALTKRGTPVTVVATQLVEAGVDLDFPVVFRAYATADAMQQAAGRCNRSGHIAQGGRVVVFEPVGGDRGAESVYGAALAVTRRYFGPERADPDDIDALAVYYRERFALTNVEETGKPVQQGRLCFDFPTVKDLFWLIEEHTVPVVVPYGTAEQREQVRDALAALRAGAASADLLRELRPFMAALPRSLVHGKARHLVVPIVGDLVEWIGDYHPQRGIEVSDSKEYVF